MPPPLFFDLLFMEDSFIHIWALLNPAYEFCTRGRKEACRRLWESFDLQRQRYTYRTIRDKKRRGEQLSPNPYFTIEDNSHQPEQRVPAAPPTNYNGSRDFDQMVATGRLCTAEYNGQVGIYTIEDVTAHHMNLIKRLQP